MRKLKLQVQMTIDGFVAGPEGQLDWIWIPGVERDEASFQKVIDLAASCDTILLGRKMTSEFVKHWENVVDNLPDSVETWKLKTVIWCRVPISTAGQIDLDNPANILA